VTPRAEELDLSSVRRLGLFGGSFDPVHAGHLHVARAAEAAFDLDHVLFVPAARPPHKPERVLAEAGDRVAMLELALAERAGWSISELELTREGPSYTFDTVCVLPDRLGLAPDVALHLIIGWDNLRGLERWHRARELLGRVQPIVILRGEDDPALLEHLAAELGPELFEKLERGFLRLEPVAISSTDLRALLARGGHPGDELPPGVLEYVRARGIYRGEAVP
jgi:nicotinate-nucleotide adenylyltransferase